MMLLALAAVTAQEEAGSADGDAAGDAGDDAAGAEGKSAEDGDEEAWLYVEFLKDEVK